MGQSSIFKNRRAFKGRAKSKDSASRNNFPLISQKEERSTSNPRSAKSATTRKFVKSANKKNVSRMTEKTAKSIMSWKKSARSRSPINKDTSFMQGSQFSRIVNLAVDGQFPQANDYEVDQGLVYDARGTVAY